MRPNSVFRFLPGNIGFKHCLLLVAAFGQALSQSSICDGTFQQGTCVCVLADGSGTVDLTRLVHATAITPLSTDGPQYSYYLALCNVINEPGHDGCSGKAAACEYDYLQNNYNLGEPDTTRFESRVDPNTQQYTPALVMDTAPDADPANQRRTLAFFACDQGTPDPAFSSDGNDGTTDPADGFYLYIMHLSGADFCPNKAPPSESTTPSTTKHTPTNEGGGLSVGSILLIVFFVLLFVYFVGGFLLLTFGFHKEGVERVPNYAFWGALPGLAKDGVVFTWHSLRQLCGSYENV